MYKHMNAQPLKPNKYHLRSNPRYRVQEKFKGIRAFLFCTEQGSYLCTRGGHYVEKNFPHLANLRGNFILDGELWQEGVEDEVISGWANSKYLTADTSGVLFQCFDIVEYRGLDLTEGATLELRDSFRGYAVKALEHPGVLYVPYLEGDSEQHFAEIVSRGGEGIMLKDLDGVYTQRDGDNRPTGPWFKQKSTETFDVIVTGFKPGKGKFEGLIGAIEYGFYTTMGVKPYGFCSGLTDDHRYRISDNPDSYLGKVLEVKAAGQDLNSGALIEPRFIRWRDDKRPEECVWNR